jgi:LmeA-like phospholipid-binding
MWGAMTPPRQSRWWDPRNPMDVMTAVWSAATLLPPVSTGAGAAYQAMFIALRRVVLGRTLTMQAAGEPLAMTVTDVVSLLNPYHLVSGRLDLRLTLTGINWGDRDFGHANVVLHNVQLRRGTPPALFAAPVEVALHLPSDTIDRLLRDARPGMSADIDDDGVARVRWARRPGWGNVEVDVDVDDGAAVAAVRVTPRALIVAGRNWKLPARTQPYRIPLTRLPPDARLTGVHVQPGMLRVDARLPEWRMPR